jgi:hypothetical protein
MHKAGAGAHIHEVGGDDLALEAAALGQMRRQAVGVLEPDQALARDNGVFARLQARGRQETVGEFIGDEQELPAGLAAIALNPGIIDTRMLRSCFGEGASGYPSPEEWAKVAVPFLVSLGTPENGKALTVPGM